MTLSPGLLRIDQLVEIIKVLGTPTREQIKTMNPNYMEHKFPQIKVRFARFVSSFFATCSRSYRPRAAPPVRKGLPATHSTRCDRPHRQAPRVHPFRPLDRY